MSKKLSVLQTDQWNLARKKKIPSLHFRTFNSLHNVSVFLADAVVNDLFRNRFLKIHRENWLIFIQQKTIVPGKK